ncbi:MAG: DUF6531 domain-containing protein, partial [Acidimicrobiales bacterium]
MATSGRGASPLRRRLLVGLLTVVMVSLEPAVSASATSALPPAPSQGGTTGGTVQRVIGSSATTRAPSTAAAIVSKPGSESVPQAQVGPNILTATAFGMRKATGSSGTARLITAAVTANPSPPFAECPAIGGDSGCQILVVVTDQGTQILDDPNQGPYDGSDDALIGVLNDSSAATGHLVLSSDNPIFAFDGDGLCTYPQAPSGCPLGPTGYEGPGVSYSNINAAETGGTVNFASGIASGNSAYFSLEEALTASTVVAGGPRAPEQGGAGNLSENATTCSTNSPVNCGTGEFWHTFADIQVPGNGVALHLTHTYTSADAAVDGPLGYGWTDSYNMSLATDGAGNVTVMQENGSTVTFSPNGYGGYIAAPRVLATLTPGAGGTYTFVRNSSQISYVFSATGKLMSETDLNSYATTLSYSGGQLSTVTDPSGRKLTFTYAGSHISQVKDPAGQTISFAYDAAGNLTKETNQASGTWTFTYDPNHLLLTMTDPNGGTTTNTYNATAQVTKQVDPAGRATTWAYTGAALSPA